MKKVVVGMSGGVDSSVTAYLLKQSGYEVVGLFMKNWEEKNSEGRCTAEADFEDASHVCQTLQIPLYSVNFVQEYWDLVFSRFVDELKLGYTPNPDILCNQEIKFDIFLEKAKKLGADFLATGHYCQTKDGKLIKGADPTKDQSYFLYTLKEPILQQVLFPIGHLHKSQVRKIAKEQNLKVANKKDSTGICFIGKRDFKEFISQYIPYQKGNFETLEKQVVGQHEGAAYYTTGQRKGLGIGGKGDAWFVVDKDMQRNVVVVAQGAHHAALYKSGLTATDYTFIQIPPSSLPYRCSAKIRYRQENEPCQIIELTATSLSVIFDRPQRAITARQSIVFYDHDVCLGGALIEKGFI